MRNIKEKTSLNRHADLIVVLTVGLLTCLWLWLCATHTFVGVGDEAIYLYDGLLLSHGTLPYRDFFLAHPPLRILISASLFLLGLPAVVGKWVAICATALNTGLIAALARKVAGPWAGIAAALLWCGGALSLETGTFFLGSNVATSFMLAACLAAAYDRCGWAGAILGVGAHQALYTLLPGPVLLWWAWQRGQTRAFILGGMTWPVGSLAAWLAFGDAYLSQTIGYHLLKVDGATQPWPVHKITEFFRADWAAVTFALASWLGRDKLSRFAALLAWQTLAVVCLYRSLQSYYFILPLALLCVAGGVGAQQLCMHVWRRHSAADEDTNPEPHSKRNFWFTTAALALIWAMSSLPHLDAALARRTFQPVVDAELTQLATMITNNPPASKMLWGDTSVTAVLALRTGLPIAANFVDTNDQRFKSGLTATSRVIDQVLRRHRPGVLMIAHHGVYRVAPLRQFVEKNYLAQFIYNGRAMGYSVVYLLPQSRIIP